MEFRHSGIGKVLAAAQCVSEMHSPTVSFINVRQSGSNPTFCHDCVCLAKQGFAHEPYF